MSRTAVVAIGALAFALTLAAGGAALAKKPKKTGLDEGDVTRIITLAMKHNNDLGHFKGQHIVVTAGFGHVERSDEATVTARADHARAFEVILAEIPAPGIFDQYVGCIVAADSDYAKLADGTPADQNPTAYDRGLFTLEGELDGLTINPTTHAAYVTLKPGCTIAPAKPQP